MSAQSSALATKIKPCERAWVRILAFDIDGTLTDATTCWLGEDVGWVQRYSVRDGEAMLRMKQDGWQLIPLSKNATLAARKRIEHLALTTRWLGVTDKVRAIQEISDAHQVAAADILFVGDGKDDAQIFKLVKRSFAVADAHPDALASASVVLRSQGGRHVMEELEGLLGDENAV